MFVYLVAPKYNFALAWKWLIPVRKILYRTIATHLQVHSQLQNQFTILTQSTVCLKGPIFSSELNFLREKNRNNFVAKIISFPLTYNGFNMTSTPLKPLGKSPFALKQWQKGSSTIPNCPVFPLCVRGDLRTSHTIPDCLALDQRYSVFIHKAWNYDKGGPVTIRGKLCFSHPPPTLVPPLDAMVRHCGHERTGSDLYLTLMMGSWPKHFSLSDEIHICISTRDD